MLAGASAVEASSSSKKPKKKKEKPVEKLPIEGTSWLRVTTNEGNIFYTNTETKTSVWTVPDEIKEQVERQLSVQKNGSTAEANDAAQADAQRLLEEKEAEMQRLREELEQEREASRKRKLQEADTDAEGQASRAQKMAKSSVTVTEGDSDQEAADEEKVEDAREQAEEEQEPEQLEDWQLDELRAKEELEAELQTPAPAAEQTDFSSEESIALFRTMLAEKDINPMKPWDMELPKFIGDPRYKGMSASRNQVNAC